MTDEELIDALRHLGIDRRSHRVLALLPLVQVAWADGTVQRAEARLIRQVAEERHLLDGDGARVLETWLAEAPTEDYVARGRACLVELARREGTELSDVLAAGALDEVVALCERVARAAGGLFGVLWTVDARERAAIAEIARALRPAA